LAKRGYNGMILHVIYDLSKNSGRYVLAQHADSYRIYGVETFAHEVEGMLESTTEEDTWMMWYNYDFVEV
jgi:hypothetical protein